MADTGFTDMHGIPIHIGDLIRCKHYKHYRGRRQMWLYFRVTLKEGKAVVQCWHDLRPDSHQCRLEHCGIKFSEVLQECPGDPMTFNERKRRSRG